MISFDKLLRTIATARIVLPATIVRLAAGRVNMSEEQQVTCFMAGANAVFTGEKMLTTDCNGWDQDHEMFKRWGFYPMRSFESERKKEKAAVMPGIKSACRQMFPSALDGWNAIWRPTGLPGIARSSPERLRLTARNA